MLLRHVLLHVHVHFWSKLVCVVQHVHFDATLPHVRCRHELRRALLFAGAEGGGLGRLGFCTYLRASRFEVSCLLKVYVYT